MRNGDFLPHQLPPDLRTKLTEWNLLVPYEAPGFQDLGFDAWNTLLKEERLGIQHVYRSIRPWNYGSMMTKIKNVIIEAAASLTPLSCHYLVDFVCRKEGGRE